MSGVPFTNIYPAGPGVDPVTGELTGGGGSAGNDQYPGMPVGASPIHKDVTIATATTTTLWDPGPGQRFVLASAFVSTDTAMRVALIDENDVQGSRPVDGYFGANGGASPNLVPVPYVSNLGGQRLRVVTAAAGNVKVRVSGWTVAS
jgi:hypothetical protein